MMWSALWILEDALKQSATRRLESLDTKKTLTELGLELEELSKDKGGKLRDANQVAIECLRPSHGAFQNSLQMSSILTKLSP